MSLTQIVKRFNEENVPGGIRSATGWSPATISRSLNNEKYAGRWIWNRTESRRDPKTGRRRRFDKPESEWMVHEDEELRIVPTQPGEDRQAPSNRVDQGQAHQFGQGSRAPHRTLGSGPSQPPRPHPPRARHA
jgi:hypothetical protein